jgi:MFS family permease
VTFGIVSLYKTVRTFYYLAMLRNRSLIGLFSAELVSLTGSSMTLLALPWFVLATTGSTAKMGWVLAARVAPQALLGIPAGSLIAWLGAKRTILVADAARGPLMSIIPILFWTGHLSFAALLVVTFAVGTFTAPYAASAALVVPEVVGDDERLVARAGAIVGTSTQITQIAGPVLAGVLISITSPANVLVVDGATFVFSFLTILLTVRVGKRAEQAPQARGLLAGVRFLLRDSLLGPIVLAACVLNFVVPGLLVGLNTLAFFHFHSNAHVAGFFYGSLGVGALAGAILAQHLTKTVDLLKISALALVAMPLPVWLLSIALPWPVVVVVVGAFSFFTPLVNAPLIGVFTVRVPPALRPKAMTAMLSSATLAGPLGYLLAGFAFGHVSVYRAFFVIAAALTLGGVAFAAILLRHRATADQLGLAADALV